MFMYLCFTKTKIYCEQEKKNEGMLCVSVYVAWTPCESENREFAVVNECVYYYIFSGEFEPTNEELAEASNSIDKNRFM